MKMNWKLYRTNLIPLISRIVLSLFLHIGKILLFPVSILLLLNYTTVIKNLVHQSVSLIEHLHGDNNMVLLFFYFDRS